MLQTCRFLHVFGLFGARIAGWPGQGLDAFTSDDQMKDLRAVFSWSYQLTTATSARVFRLTGLHPGPDLPVAAAAALAGTTPERIRAALAELERAQLITQPAPDRYTSHDLLRVYARELAESLDKDECHQALWRLLDHYLRTADAGDQWLRPHRDPEELPAALGTTYVERFGGYQEAFDWFEAEHLNLVALVGRAARRGFDGHATHLARTITGFLERRGLWSTWTDVMQTAVESSERAGDLRGQVISHRYRAHALTRLNRLDEGLVEAETALRLAEQLDDQVVQAWCQRVVAFVLSNQERLQESYEHEVLAAELFSRSGHLTGHALSLNYVGWLHAHAFCEYDEAVRRCRQAQELYQGIDHKLGEAATWDHLGYAYRGLRELTEAVQCYQRALELYEVLNDVYYQARMLRNLGDVQQELGDEDAAGVSWEASLDLLIQLDHPDAEALDERLRTLTY